MVFTTTRSWDDLGRNNGEVFVNEKTLMKALEWALGDDTGSSSKSLCKFMLGIEEKHPSFPLDAADRGRCIRLLNLIPEWWDYLYQMEYFASKEILVYDQGGFRREESGWKEQIPLIKQEAGRKQ